MRSFAIIALCAFVAHTHAKDAKDAKDVLVDRALNARPLHKDLDETALGKPGNLAMSRPASSVATPALRQSSLGRPMPPSSRPQIRAAEAQLSKFGISSTPLSRLAITSMDALYRGDSVKARAEVKAEADGLDGETKEKVAAVTKSVKEKALEMPGITAPLGFFDPLGFTAECDEGTLLFYREVELKHGRVGMLAALGFLVGENFHPLFGGNINVPSYIAFQQTPLQTFWPAVVTAIAIPEAFHVFAFQNPFGSVETGFSIQNGWKMRTDRTPGDFNWDPLGLKPTDPKELKELQTKEINNGRLAMLAAAGMIAQELATKSKLF